MRGESTRDGSMYPHRKGRDRLADAIATLQRYPYVCGCSSRGGKTAIAHAETAEGANSCTDHGDGTTAAEHAKTIRRFQSMSDGGGKETDTDVSCAAGDRGTASASVVPRLPADNGRGG